MLGRSLMLAGAAAVLFAAPSAAQDYPDYVPPQSGAYSSAPSTDVDDTVDIVLTYTSGMEGLHGLGLRDHVNTEIAWLNDALVRAGRTGGTRLVGLRLVDYEDDYATDFRFCFNPTGGWDDWDEEIAPCESPVVYGAIHDLAAGANNAQGDLSWLQGWRSSSGADLVGMNRRYYSGSHAGICGVAVLPEVNAHATNAEYNNFFLLGTQLSGACSEPSTLAHEVGHNFGLRHEDDATNGYGRGYITSGDYHTIMTAYIEPGDHHDFSNPSRNCPSVGGYQCGVSNQHDAARYLREDEFGVPAYNSLGSGMQITASVAPLARAATYSGSPSVTYFAAMQNSAGTTATGCGVELPGHNAHFDFEVYGSGNTNAEFDISASSATNLLLTYRPQSAGLTAQPLEFEFYCDNRRSATIVPGVNTGFITTSSTSTPDIFAAAPAQNFVIDTVGGGAVLAAFATTNLGASGTVSVSIVEPNGFTEIGSSVDLPVTLKLCETNPSTGACLNSFATSPISVSYSGSPDNHTFAIAMWATSAIPVDGYNNRIYLVFRDGSGRLIGATGIPVCTTGQTNCSN